MVNNIHFVEKNDYKYSGEPVIVGGHYLNDILKINNNNNNFLEGGGTAIYSKLEKYGVPAGLYVSPISNNTTLHKIETIIDDHYDFEKMSKLYDNLYTGIVKNIHKNTRKQEKRYKTKTRKQ